MFISASSYLPPVDPGDFYFVRVEESNGFEEDEFRVCYFYDGKWALPYKNLEVTHWMPIPRNYLDDILDDDEEFSE